MANNLQFVGGKLTANGKEVALTESIPASPTYGWVSKWTGADNSLDVSDWGAGKYQFVSGNGDAVFMEIDGNGKMVTAQTLYENTSTSADYFYAKASVGGPFTVYTQKMTFNLGSGTIVFNVVDSASKTVEILKWEEI
ncbi:MAG: hypothetical protein K0U20_09390 [Proteobacteria bacterium]|nr:hypothetical protein [Pseudomonadota bacterium]MCH9735794.1 hypothetical protein [Actinomycetes bacterium]